MIFPSSESFFFRSNSPVGGDRGVGGVIFSIKTQVLKVIIENNCLIIQCNSHEPIQLHSWCWGDLKSYNLSPWVGFQIFSFQTVDSQWGGCGSCWYYFSVCWIMECLQLDLERFAPVLASCDPCVELTVRRSSNDLVRWLVFRDLLQQRVRGRVSGGTHGLCWEVPLQALPLSQELSALLWS